MTLASYTLPQLFVLVFLLFFATAIDIYKHKIPNVLVLLILFSGVVIQCYANGTQGGISATIGMSVGLILLLPFYLLGGMRAGDVKLMSSVGSYLGLATFMGVAMTLMMGAVTGILILLLHKDMFKFIKRYYQMAKQLLYFQSMTYIPAEKNDASRLQFPYASAIASGTLLTIYLFPGMSR